MRPGEIKRRQREKFWWVGEKQTWLTGNQFCEILCALIRIRKGLSHENHCCLHSLGPLQLRYTTRAQAAGNIQAGKP